MEPITAGFKHVLTYFKLAGEKPGDPCLARIYYCLQLAGDKASASTLLYKPQYKLISVSVGFLKPVVSLTVDSVRCHYSRSVNYEAGKIGIVTMLDLVPDLCQERQKRIKFLRVRSKTPLPP